MFTLAKDPYSPREFLSPWLHHQAVCSDGTTLFINCPLERQHSVVHLSFHSSLSEFRAMVHDFSMIQTCGQLDISKLLHGLFISPSTPHLKMFLCKMLHGLLSPYISPSTPHLKMSVQNVARPIMPIHLSFHSSLEADTRLLHWTELQLHNFKCLGLVAKIFFYSVQNVAWPTSLLPLLTEFKAVIHCALGKAATIFTMIGHTQQRLSCHTVYHTHTLKVVCSKCKAM